jgi:hypothetical protein
MAAALPGTPSTSGPATDGWFLTAPRHDRKGNPWLSATIGETVSTTECHRCDA